MMGSQIATAPVRGHGSHHCSRCIGASGKVGKRAYRDEMVIN